MARFNVVGTSGSGNSTFSAKLASKLELRHVQIDQVFWEANWHEPPDAEFFPKLTEALSGDDWVLDGNYNRTAHIKWKNPVIVVWLDLPFATTLRQAVVRAFGRSWRKNELWPGTNCRESFRKSFLSSDSIILWTIKTYKKNREQYLRLINNPPYPHMQFVHLRSHQEADQYLESL